MKTNFVENANLIHKNKYDYSLVNYTNNKTIVKIICTIHGVFEKRPDTHLRGSGCPICSINLASAKLRKTNIQFITEANISHVYKYDYSKVEYINQNKKIEIICPNHGSFLQTPKKSY